MLLCRVSSRVGGAKVLLILFRGGNSKFVPRVLTKLFVVDMLIKV